MPKYSKVKTVEDVKSLLKHYLVGIEVKDLTTGLVSHCSSYVALALFNRCEYVSHRHSEFGGGEVLELKVRSTENEVANKYAEFLAKHRGSVKVYSTYDGKVAVMLKDSLIWEYLNGK